jgi:outer membrane protein
VAIAEARLAAARGNLASAVGDLEIGRESYMAAVGRAPGNLRWPSAPPIVAKTESAAKALAERNHPSIDEAQHNVNVAELNNRRAKAAMGPSVTSSAAVNLDDSFESSFQGSLQLNVPIYQGGRLRALARQAAARRDATRAALLQSVVLVRQDVGTAWARLQVAAARTGASRRQVSASQVAYNGVREEAKLGSRTTLDVLNAEQELLDARTSLITAEVQQYVSVYTLLSAMGLLTSEHLKLGIVTYDPVEYYNYSSTQAPISMRGTKLDKVLKSLGKQ